MECCQLLCISSSELLIEFRHVDGGAAFVVNRWSVETLFKKAVEITDFFGHMELADPGIMIDEGVSLGLSAGDCATIRKHDFIG